MHRTRMTIGSNMLDYNKNTKVLTTDLVTMKLLLNSILSIPEAKFMTIDIKNFYLEIELREKQYMFLLVELVPDKIITHYKLQDKIHNGKIYMQINKSIYSLKEAGILANK